MSKIKFSKNTHLPLTTSSKTLLNFILLQKRQKVLQTIQFFSLNEVLEKQKFNLLKKKHLHLTVKSK